jgi:hypothetical protein
VVGAPVGTAVVGELVTTMGFTVGATEGTDDGLLLGTRALIGSKVGDSPMGSRVGMFVGT